MAHPYGQEFTIVDSASPFLCDICTSPIDSKHIATSVGGAGQSAVCWDCVKSISQLNRNSMRVAAVA